MVKASAYVSIAAIVYIVVFFVMIGSFFLVRKNSRDLINNINFPTPTKNEG